MAGKPLADLIAARVSRRTVFKGLGALAAASALPSCANGASSSLTFKSVAQKLSPDDALADGYERAILIRWGDAVLDDAARFDPEAQTGDAQARQFGYNNDFVAYLPLPRGSANSERGLLWVNHEYTSNERMFAAAGETLDPPVRVAVCKAAHGGSLIEIELRDGRWNVMADSPYARRVTADTEIDISGPAAGHTRLMTGGDPTGRRARGTIGNCAGGRTPWGTVLTAEEGSFNYFSGNLPVDSRELENAKRMRVRDSYGWGVADPRFDLAREPNEMNRFNWIVEIDPYEPGTSPVKRTALGRFVHEAATVVVAPDGRAVVYMGDDGPNEYIYRFVSRDRVDADDPKAKWGLLDEGTLYVARFDETELEWIPLVQGADLLIDVNGFVSQADVLIETRAAADLVKATPMDRPEDIEASPITGRVYVVLTDNLGREEPNVANPRANNLYGHILELVPPAGSDGKPDHAADRFAWNVFLLAGDEASGATAHPQSEAKLGMPDNCAFDPKGRLWIATDKSIRGQNATGWPDGLYACDTDGPERALLKMLYAAPIGAEVCGPEFTPDGTTLFLAVQHPGEGSTFDEPSTRWPDFEDSMPPRPSVIAIRRRDGGPVGG